MEKRKESLRSSLILTSLIVLPAFARAQDRPNVLLIMADDMGYECLGTNGGTWETPRLDRMAEEGMLFENCHSQPLSTPSRVELMTGMYNDRNYIDFGFLDPKQRTFAHMAKDAGYETCIAGKWQLGFDNRLPEVFGFDHYCLWQLAHEQKEGERYANVLYEKDGQLFPKNIDNYGPDIFSNYIEDFLVSRRDKSKPFFAYYPMVLIHAPFQATPDSKEWKDEDLREVNDTLHMPDMMKYTDKIVGRLLDVLDREGLRKNTVVIFIGDNGTNVKIHTPMKDGRSIQGGKGKTIRYGTHVPMIVSWPGTVRPGQTNSNLIDFTDFYVTFRDIIGGAPSLDRKLDGISFHKQLLGKKGKTRRWSFCHYQPIHRITYVRFAQTASYKLYADGRFFNTVSDPLEKHAIPPEEMTRQESRTREMLKRVLESRPSWGEGILTDKSNL